MLSSAEAAVRAEARVLPGEYPLRGSVRSYLSAEQGFGRLVDFGVIIPRLQQLFEWSAHELGEPGLLAYVRDGPRPTHGPLRTGASGSHQGRSCSR